MAALGATALTMTDWAKRLDPNGSVPTIVELLNETNGLLDDALFLEGNLPTGHRTTVRTGLPTVYWRQINQGVLPSKSTTAQVDEQCGMLEAWSEVDVELLALNGNSAAFRLSEAKAFIEGMNQEMSYTFVYGNGGTDPEEFSGLSVRYSDLSATNAQNIIDAAGTQNGDQTSIWLVGWGSETVHGIFPKGSSAGLSHKDFGEETVEVTAGIAGSRMRAMREKFMWKAGLVVKDWRYVVRICNIDVSDLAGGSPPDLIEALENAVELLPSSLGRPVLYANRTVRRFLRKQVREGVSAGGGLNFDNFGGKKILMFGDVPIRTLDTILNTEDRVV